MHEIMNTDSTFFDQYYNRINRERNMTRTNKRKRDSTDDVDAILEAAQDELDLNEKNNNPHHNTPL